MPAGGVQIASPRVGFALSGEPTNGLDQNLSAPGAPILAWPSPSVVVTRDGARHWIRSLAVPAGFWGVDAVNAKDVWAVGVTALYRSIDGGMTWQHAREPRKPLVRVAFTSPSTGFGLTVNGRLVQTTNSGESWTASRWHGRGVAVCSMNGGTMLVAGETGGVWRSASGGNGWRQVAPRFAQIEQYAGWPTQLSCQGSNAVELSQSFCEAACGGGVVTNIRQATDNGRLWRTIDVQQVGPAPTRSRPMSELKAPIEDAAALGTSGACVVGSYQDRQPVNIEIGCTGLPSGGYRTAAVPELPFGSKRDLAGVQGIDFLNARTGWLLLNANMGTHVGGSSGDRARTEILATHNGGMTWQRADVSPTYPAITCPGSGASAPVCWKNPLG
jgi:hypothetical protein